MNKLDDQLQRLETILSEKRPGYVAEAANCLAEISKEDTPHSIGRLLRLFDESAPDELMFSIVHSIEQLDDRTYCMALLDSVERLWTTSPRWAQILHIRVMNSQNTADVYFGMVEAAPSATRAIVRSIYEAVSKGWPKLAEKVRPILVRLQAQTQGPFCSSMNEQLRQPVRKVVELLVSGRYAEIEALTEGSRCRQRRESVNICSGALTRCESTLPIIPTTVAYRFF